MFPEDRFVEILIIGALALIVIGPKDLPVMMRRLGQFIGKMRGMAAEFRASFDELARQSELDDLRKEVDALRQTQAGASLNPLGEAHMKSTFDDINTGLASQPAPTVTQQPSAPEPVAEVAPPPPAPPVTPPKTPRKSRAKAKTAGEAP